MNTPQVSRRVVLTTTAATAVALPAAQLLPGSANAAGRRAAPQPDQRSPRAPTGRPSRNGWEMESAVDHGGSIYTRPVPGTPLDGVAVRIGEVETVLVHVIRRFHYEIDMLGKGDVVGWRSPDAVKKSFAESNQASGTAVQIRPGHYPAGASGGFSHLQDVVIRDILAELDGLVRWGGDDRRPNEALFYLNGKPGDARLAKVADRIRTWMYTPGAGAGSGVDVMSASRRKAAKKLERAQKPR